MADPAAHGPGAAARAVAPRAIAFFDVDHTLLRGSTGHFATRYLVSKGVLRPRVFVRAAYYTAMHYLGYADADRMMREAATVFRGMRVEDVRRWADDCYATLIRPHVLPKGRMAVEQHLARGDEVVLLSAGPQLVINAFARDLGVHAIAQDSVVDENQVYTGEPVLPICYGPGKLERARAYCEERGVQLADCAFYSDSVSDVPLLRAVGHPRAVDPDPKLRWLARRDGWPILSFLDR